MSRILVVGLAPGKLPDELRLRGHDVFITPDRSRTTGAVQDVVPDLLVLLAAGPAAGDRPIFEALERDEQARLVPVLHVVRADEQEAESLELGAGAAVAAGAPTRVLLAKVEALLRQRRQLESLLDDRQRTVLLELAGAVAHRMNQPLTSLGMKLDLLALDGQRGRIAPGDLAGRVEELTALVDELARTVRQVRDIVEYRTTGYVRDLRILDLDASSRRENGNDEG